MNIYDTSLLRISLYKSS